MLSDRIAEKLGESPAEDGVSALLRLVTVAQGDSGQCRYVRRFLLGLYNGAEWPFNLNSLRAIDSNLQDDALRVLQMDMTPHREVHEYIKDGDALFREWWHWERNNEKENWE